MQKICFTIILALTAPFYLFAQSNKASNLYEKHFQYTTLSPLQKQIFDAFIEEEIPKGTQFVLTEKLGARNTMRLACALFYRNQAGDVENAVSIVKWIFLLQNLDETRKNYAIWRGNIKPTNDYDQNMREFIGTDLITIYHKYKDKLPEDVKKELEVCLIRTAKGALKRNVDPNYNNISIMSSFMMEYVGTAFQIQTVYKRRFGECNGICTTRQSMTPTV